VVAEFAIDWGIGPVVVVGPYAKHPAYCFPEPLRRESEVVRNLDDGVTKVIGGVFSNRDLGVPGCKSASSREFLIHAHPPGAS
jgi:hypothetical protein